MSNTATYTATEAVAREIRGLLAKAGLTQKDVASILAITQAGVSDRLRGKQNFSLDELLTLAGALNLTIGDLLGDSIVSARVPAPSYIEEGQGRIKRKVAPIGFIPKGATYDIIPGDEASRLVGSVGLEPTTKGLLDLTTLSPAPGLLFCPATLNTSHHISYTRSPPCFCFGNHTRPRSPLGNSRLEKPNPPRLLANAGSSTLHAPTHPRQP